MLGYPEGTRYTVLAPILLREDRTMETTTGRLIWSRASTVWKYKRRDDTHWWIWTKERRYRFFIDIDRMVASKEKDAVSRLTDSAETAMYEGDGACLLRFYQPDGTTSLYRFSTKFEADGIAFLKSRATRCFLRSPSVPVLSAKVSVK